MALRSHLDGYIWPASLLCTFFIGLSIWGHHNVIETKAGFAREADAVAWAKQEARDQRCVAMTEKISTNDRNSGDIDLTEGRAFSAELKCNQRSIWWKLGAALVGPWLLMALGIRIADSSMQTKR